ncbi:hypothetical protein BGZ72_003023, partial [Mortierella alpina]
SAIVAGASVLNEDQNEETGHQHGPSCPSSDSSSAILAGASIRNEAQNDENGHQHSPSNASGDPDSGILAGASILNEDQNGENGHQHGPSPSRDSTSVMMGTSRTFGAAEDNTHVNGSSP